ncbi:MAG: flagellar protein FlaG [Bacteroides sp.]
MGIEAISGVTGAASFQAQSAPAAKPSVKQAEEVRPAEQPVAQSETTSQPVVIAKVEENAQGGKAGNDQQQKQEPSESSMKNVAKDMNKLINQNTIAEFGYHEETHRITIKIKDKDTDEVIKEIPSEKALEMLKKAWEIAGILVDEKR